MTNESWQDGNNRYLAASLQWLRLRLQRLVREEPASASPQPRASETTASAGEKTPGVLSRWLGGSSPATTTASKPVPLLPEPKPSEGKKLTPSSALAAAAAAREAAAKMDPPPALLLLAQRLGLSDFERDTLLLAAAAEYDPGFANLYAAAQGGSRTYPTFGLALAELDDASWEALAAHRPLRQDHLLEINQPGATPLTSSPLRVDERIVNFLKGLNVLDDRLASLLSPVDTTRAAVTDSQHAAVETILERLHDAVQESVLPVVQLVGSDPGSKIAVAAQACATLNRQLYRVDLEALPHQAAEMETLARLWQRETFLLPVSLYIDAENLDSASAESQAVFQRFLSRGLGLVFLGVRDAPVRLSVPGFPVEVRKPTPAEQYAAWSGVLGATEDAAAATLAGQFHLNLADIEEVALLAARAPSEQGPLSHHLWNTCRDLTRPSLDILAQRLDVKAGWDDLVLPDDQMNLMRAIAGQVRGRHTVYDDWGFSQKMNRGFGISALFAGESGTGKTMAAEVIANDLQLNLYRIDLSAVVSKYIGETEKNLRRLFDAAEQGGAILFFDEADALFGKRSEVKDSHDRYANIEINYLLQRMEAFGGLAILATNMKTALDPAFLRRLRFVVNFPFPGLKERKLIWQKVLPLQVPQEALDFDRLARLSVAGAHIHSIALNAAFVAAETDQPVSMPVLLAAARTELRKLEKPFTESEFRR
jgi:ATPase family protein associated with various cellular activities (AAA)/winged helix domain-containing protein